MWFRWRGVFFVWRSRKTSLIFVFHLVGTGTSVRPPSVVAWARRTKATKGLLRKSTSPTKTLDASASLGIFFMNLFFSCRKVEGREIKKRGETFPTKFKFLFMFLWHLITNFLGKTDIYNSISVFNVFVNQTYRSQNSLPRALRRYNENFSLLTDILWGKTYWSIEEIICCSLTHVRTSISRQRSLNFPLRISKTTMCVFVSTTLSKRAGELTRPVWLRVKVWQETGRQHKNTR